MKVYLGCENSYKEVEIDLMRPLTPGGSERKHGVRCAYFGPNRGSEDAVVLERADLQGVGKAGPYIVEEYDSDSTMGVPPGCRAKLDLPGDAVNEIVEER